MRLCLHVLFSIQLLFFTAISYAQAASPAVSKEPAWITRHEINYNTTSLDKEATDGYINISYERQVYLADQSEYFRLSKKIISQAGVQNGSEVSVSFDPSFEKLFFHSIHVIRNGGILNRLQLSKIKTLHQEKDLAEFIYNGSLNAVLILDDIRQGDIIEYSYTRKGFNPIFKNKYATEFSLAFSVPIYELYYKMVVPGGRKINIKNLYETLPPTVSTADGQQVYEWRKRNVPPLILQDYTPSWYDPFAKVLVSEYNSWKEVNDWAQELFPVKKDLSAAVTKKIREIESACKNDEDRTRAALRFVQDEIRYMGIETGIHSHKPADPSKVFAQRFGDCKEKSYLLCCMLHAMNIDASPVLINTSVKKAISALLPAPTDFDHATVRVKVNNIYYWFDPTIAYQRGRLNNLFYPDYQAGLVISDSTGSITPIDFRNISKQHVQEYFKVPSMSGAGTLIVTTRSEGNAADEARNDFNNESITGLMTNYQKFYAGYYEDIKADSLNFTDNDSTGEFTTTEYYTIPNFWTLINGKMNKFSFSPFVINSILKRPKEKVRTMPFKLQFPAKYREELIVDLPQNWKVTESETHLKNNCYSYHSKFYGVFNRVHLDTDYENYKDHAATEDVPAYFKDLREYDDIGSFEVTSGSDDLASNRADTSGKNIFLAIALFSAFAGGIVWWSRRK